jgi:hypothetical protein
VTQRAITGQGKAAGLITTALFLAALFGPTLSGLANSGVQPVGG